MPDDDLAIADQVLAGLRSVVDRGDANATFAAYTEGFAACLRILRDALGLDEEAVEALSKAVYDRARA